MTSEHKEMFELLLAALEESHYPTDEVGATIDKAKALFESWPKPMTVEEIKKALTDDTNPINDVPNTTEGTVFGNWLDENLDDTEDKQIGLAIYTGIRTAEQRILGGEE